MSFQMNTKYTIVALHHLMITTAVNKQLGK